MSGSTRKWVRSRPAESVRVLGRTRKPAGRRDARPTLGLGRGTEVERQGSLMDPIHGEVDRVFAVAFQLQTVDLEDEVDGGAVEILEEPDGHLRLDSGDDAFAVLVGNGHAELVVALLDPVDPEPGHDRASGQDQRDLLGVDPVEATEDAELAAVVGCGFAEGEDFQFQHREPTPNSGPVGKISSARPTAVLLQHSGQGPQLEEPDGVRGLEPQAVHRVRGDDEGALAIGRAIQPRAGLQLIAGVRHQTVHGQLNTPFGSGG